MRIAELSKLSGVPVPTIKYYLREGLLTAGELSSPNQASYNEIHLRRLRLIRALLEVGGLSVAAIRDVLAAVDEPDLSMWKLLGVVSDSLQKHETIADDEEWRRARATVEALLLSRGWIDHDSFWPPAANTLTMVALRLSQLGYESFVSEALTTYLDAAEKVADLDVDYVLRFPDREDVVDGVVVLTVLGEAALSAARLIAHRHVSATKLGIPAPQAD
ncbi:MerR family transcriptional regulator [Nocardia sp. NPDC051030]|uniref:MerR family transcriptional regulator n=1 Tax=Nocardia sp. NPDC051030 TaxID=3155162 RepID=UPI00341665B7